MAASSDILKLQCAIILKGWNVVFYFSHVQLCSPWAGAVTWKSRSPFERFPHEDSHWCCPPQVRRLWARCTVQCTHEALLTVNKEERACQQPDVEADSWAKIKGNTNRVTETLLAPISCFCWSGIFTWCLISRKLILSCSYKTMSGWGERMPKGYHGKITDRQFTDCSELRVHLMVTHL